MPCFVFLWLSIGFRKNLCCLESTIYSMATLDNGFVKLKKKNFFEATIYGNAKLLMVIVAASNKYKVNVMKPILSC